MADKYTALIDIIRGYGSAAIAFSGGVDSTFLLTAAVEALGDNAIAVTAKSLSFPTRELNAAKAFCMERGIRHIICDSEELAIDGFSHNPANRCYLCKSGLFTEIREICEQEGIAEIAEGSNLDDNGDYRPGLKAVEERGIRSPLREAGFTKKDIREKSKELGLSTWDKPSFACLASRFPYGEEITAEKLRQVDESEQYLLDLGIRQVRVRHHGTLARIETDAEGFRTLAANERRAEVYDAFKKIGFAFTALDLKGYRTGAMNETL
ncbi:MAG: ATP-dependent sacrificial sulfur transferase LarE [Oscillospiraceae bacterium]|jgi:uncharacterized protein|nr:ATP-dependent sacrificial sulfur transferase LarE [Oscillospiraceae bacterium]